MSLGEIFFISISFSGYGKYNIENAAELINAKQDRLNRSQWTKKGLFLDTNPINYLHYGEIVKNQDLNEI
jgi:hypothetical protein